MTKAGRIISVKPPYAIPGGEVSIECEGFTANASDEFAVVFNDIPARIVGASSTRVLAIVPDGFDETDVEVRLRNGDDLSDPLTMIVGRKLADEMHIVANPAIDPKDDSIILTRSGSRGQLLPATLFRLDGAGFVEELSVDVMNPTGIAFDKKGCFFVTNRSDGEVCRIDDDSVSVTIANDLGVATGIAFDADGVLYIGDRAGTVYKLSDPGHPEPFATLEPSVSAYHMAFGLDGRLFVSAPGLASYDAVYSVDRAGFETRFFRGLGRPQGLAFDISGNLYVAACIGGRRGIVKISPDGEKGDLFVAGNNVIGLCFTRRGEMIVATSEAVYSLPISIYGTLLD